MQKLTLIFIGAVLAAQTSLAAAKKPFTLNDLVAKVGPTAACAVLGSVVKSTATNIDKFVKETCELCDNPELNKKEIALIKKVATTLSFKNFSAAVDETDVDVILDSKGRLFSLRKVSGIGQETEQYFMPDGTVLCVVLKLEEFH